MIGRMKLFICSLAVALLIVTSLTTPDAAADFVQQPSQEAPAQQRTLTAQERRGKALYLRGENGTGREVSAMIGELDVPASTVTCAGCHGARAEGKTEAGVTAGNLVWSNLVKPYGHTHPTGRKHGPFDEAAFARAVTRGVDPNGNELLAAMPRYKLTTEELADIVAYLKRIETERDPGLSETSVKVGVLLPTKGALAESGAAMKEVLTAYFAEVNEGGGIYNRRIEFAVTDTSEGAAGVAAARDAVRRGEVFAFVGGLTAGVESEVAALARDEEIPFIGAASLLPQEETPPNRYVFYFLSGMREQARALVNFAASKTELKKTPAVILNADYPLASAAAQAAEEQAKKQGWGIVTRQTYARNAFDAARFAQTLKQQNASAVFLFGNAGDEAALLKEAAAIGWTPHLFLPGVLAGRELAANAPAAFKEKIFLTFPTIPSDVSAAARNELGALYNKHKLTPRHTASQLSALAAARVFVEALKRAGHDLTREKLVTALEGLYEYETGLTPRLTFGPNRRVGAAGAYLITIDTDKKEFAIATGWVSAN